MGYDPVLMQLGGLQVGPHVDPTAAVPAGFAAGSGAGGHIGGSQAQQALQQPQHRRLSSWPSSGLVPGQCVVIVDVVVVPTYENVRLQPPSVLQLGLLSAESQPHFLLMAQTS